MKITLEKNEVYNAIQFYLMLRGYEPLDGITQHWTNGDGLHHVDVRVKSHNYTDESILRLLKNN